MKNKDWLTAAAVAVVAYLVASAWAKNRAAVKAASTRYGVTGSQAQMLAEQDAGLF